MATRRVPIAEAEEIAQRVLDKWGVEAEERDCIVENLIEAELVGRRSHGLSRLGLIKYAIDSKQMRLTRDPIAVITESVNHVFIDGQGRSGFYVISKALELVFKKIVTAKIVVAGLSNTAPSTGLVGLYARKATEQRLVFLGLSNCDGGLVPAGLTKAIWGTNPITIGVPAEEHPIILDMASSVVNWGEIYTAHKERRDLPPGVAIDERGDPTTDPAEALKGGILPFAGHKGSGLSFVVEVLAGALTRSRVGGAVPGGWGTLFIVLDPTLFGSYPEFLNGIQALVAEMKTAEKMPGTSDVYYPGERSGLHRAEALSAGSIDIDENVYSEIIGM